MHTFAIPYAIFMHLGSEEEITLLEFDEVEEGDQQENPQAAAPKGEEQNPEELLECPNHRPTSFLKGKPQSTLEALLGSAPLLWERQLEESSAGPLPLLRRTPAMLSLPSILDA